MSKRGQLEHLIVRADEIRLKTTMQAISDGRVTCTFDNKTAQAFTEFTTMADAEKFVEAVHLRRHWVAKALDRYAKENPIKEEQHIKENSNENIRHIM